MKVYLVESKDWHGYDTYKGFVVQANSPKQARELAQKAIAGEKYAHKSFWLNPKYSTVKQIGTNDKKRPGIILASFHAG